MMPEVCNNIGIEPHLQPVTSEEISCASQQPGWCLCQDGTSQPQDGTSQPQDGASASTQDGASASIQDGASASIQDGASASIQDGASASIRDGASVNTRDDASTSSQDGTRLDVAAELLGEWFERAFLTLGFPTHSHLKSAIPIAVLLPEA